MNNLISIALIWRIAILRLFIYCLVSVGVGYLGAMGNQHWTELDGDSRFKLLLGLTITVLSIILAFLDKTAANLAQGIELPPDIDPDDKVLKRAVTSSVATSAAIPATENTPPVPPITTAVTTSEIVTQPKESKT